jgi:hypothetical protein
VSPILAAFAALITQEAPSPAPASEAVQAIEVTAAGRIRGDMQTGTLAYPPTFFTAVRPSTALDMINWLPGFTVEDTRDFRGREGSTGNVLIDGKPPTSKTDTLLSVLRRIPASQVERVELIVGGAPGINMRGRNIIANVVLKVSATSTGTITANATADERGRTSPQLTLTRSAKHDGVASEVSLELSRNNAIFPGFGYGPLTRRDGAGALVYGGEASVLVGGPSMVGNGSYERPLGGGRVRINGSGRIHTTPYDERLTLKPGPGEYRFHHEDTYRQGELGVRYERAFGRLALELQGLERLSSLKAKDDNRRPPVFSTATVDGKQNETVLRSVLRFKKNDTLTIEGFAEGALNTSSTLSTSAIGGVPQVLPGADFSIRERRGETGATAAWKPNATFSLDAALKVEGSVLKAQGDADIERRFTYLKPKLAISWAVDKNTQLRLRAEQEVGQVGFGSFITFAEPNTNIFRVGNPDLRPQRTVVAEAVLQRKFWTGGDLSFTVRAKALRDVTEVAPLIQAGGVFGVISNIGDGRQTDLIANLTLPLKNLGLTGGTLKGSVTWNRMRVTDPTDGSHRPLSNQPQHLAELHYAQDLPALKINFGADAYYRGRTTTYRPFGNEERSPWPRLNVFIEYRPTPPWNLRAELQNIPGVRVRVANSVYRGLRTTTPLTYIEERRLSNGTLLNLRLRRTFG